MFSRDEGVTKSAEGFFLVFVFVVFLVRVRGTEAMMLEIQRDTERQREEAENFTTSKRTQGRW